jgi:hypothetical protein
MSSDRRITIPAGRKKEFWIPVRHFRSRYTEKRFRVGDGEKDPAFYSSMDGTAAASNSIGFLNG